MINPTQEEIMSDEEYLRMEKSNDAVSAMVDALDAQKNSTPNYWSVIPPFVKYNKSLTYFERILYSEISALSNKFGYCFANNQYFMDNFGNSERTVRVSLAHLAELGFISFQNEITAIGTKRKIYVNALRGAENSPPGGSKTAPHRDEKPPENGVDVDISQGKGKGNSTTSNSISISKDIGDRPVQALPTWMGKSAYARLVKLYETMWAYKMGTKPEPIKPSSAGSRVLAGLAKKYSEELSALIVIVHFDWRGANGSDNSIHDRMRNQGYPVTWIQNSAPLYESFIKNYLKITTKEEALSRLNDVLTELGNAPE